VTNVPERREKYECCVKQFGGAYVLNSAFFRYVMLVPLKAAINEDCEDFRDKLRITSVTGVFRQSLSVWSADAPRIFMIVVTRDR